VTDDISDTLPEPVWFAPQMITEDAYSAEQMRHAQQEAALTFTAAQAQNLLDMFGGDEGLITVCLLPADGDNPGGLYGHMTEYPEDGSVFLGPANEEPTQTQSPVPALDPLLTTADAQPVAKPIGYFVRRSEFGPWIETVPTEYGAQAFYTAAQPLASQDDNARDAARYR
jgi:hypothetical protein